MLIMAYHQKEVSQNYIIVVLCVFVQKPITFSETSSKIAKKLGVFS